MKLLQPPDSLAFNKANKGFGNTGEAYQYTGLSVFYCRVVTTPIEKLERENYSKNPGNFTVLHRCT